MCSFPTPSFSQCSIWLEIKAELDDDDDDPASMILATPGGQRQADGATDADQGNDGDKEADAAPQAEQEPAEAVAAEETSFFAW